MASVPFNHQRTTAVALIHWQMCYIYLLNFTYWIKKSLTSETIQTTYLTSVFTALLEPSANDRVDNNGRIFLFFVPFLTLVVLYDRDVDFKQNVSGWCCHGIVQVPQYFVSRVKHLNIRVKKENSTGSDGILRLSLAPSGYRCNVAVEGIVSRIG